LLNLNISNKTHALCIQQKTIKMRKAKHKKWETTYGRQNSGWACPIVPSTQWRSRGAIPQSLLGWNFFTKKLALLGHRASYEPSTSDDSLAASVPPHIKSWLRACFDHTNTADKVQTKYCRFCLETGTIAEHNV